MKRKIILVLLLILYIPSTAWCKTPYTARVELHKLGIRFSKAKFIDSVKEGDIVAVKLFLDAGMDSNVSDDDGITALMIAIRNNSTEIVKALLLKGADPNAIVCIVCNDDSGLTPFMKASDLGYTDIMKLLLAHGANVNAEDSYGDTALIRALGLEFFEEEENVPRWLRLKARNWPVVKLLLEHKADVNAKDNNGDTALMKASYIGSTDVANLLIKYGADVNAKNNRGQTALMYASFTGSTTIAKLLINHKADVNAKDSHGETALMKASDKGHTDIVKLLLEHGAEEQKTQQPRGD